MDKIIWIIVGLVIVIFLVGPLNLFSIFPIGTQISCSGIADDKLGCSIINQDRIVITEQIPERDSVSFHIKNYRILDDGINIYEKILKKQNIVYGEFASTHGKCGSDGDRIYYLAPEYNNWDGGLFDEDKERWKDFGASLTDGECSQGRFPPNRQIQLNAPSITKNFFDNQIIVITGTHFTGSEDYPEQLGSFKVAGLCELVTGNCIVDKTDITSLGKGNLWFDVDSITIYMKVGGYEDFCIENGIESCEGENYLVCQGFSFENRGKVDGRCGYSEGIDREELGIIINKWIDGQITRNELGIAILEWTG